VSSLSEAGDDGQLSAAVTDDASVVASKLESNTLRRFQKKANTTMSTKRSTLISLV